MSNVEIITATHRAVSRRSFIKGVIASGAVAYSAGYVFRGASAAYAQTGAQGAVERLISLSINGQRRRVDVLPQDTLAMVLRYKLGLTGTKFGCDRAECGACTVLVDEVPHYSCSILAHSIRGRQVTTIEGLASPTGELSPVQQAVMDEAGFQCAFCAPGFIMAMTGFLATNDSPTRREAAEGISGNLCRCCDYNKILDSCMRAADYVREGIPTEVNSNG
jgi:aerobic-type carbon monoxide dehydrogenase small subunit (CoxS/CutS family)